MGIADFHRCPWANFIAFTCISSGAIHTVYLHGSVVAIAVEAALTEN